QHILTLLLRKSVSRDWKVGAYVFPLPGWFWCRQKGRRRIDADRFSDGIEMMDQHLLSSGFDVGQRGARNSDLRSQLGLSLAGFFAKLSDSRTEMSVDVHRVHPHFIGTNPHNVNFTNINVCITNCQNDCY